MLFSNPRPGILVAHERHSRLTIAHSLVQMLEPLAPKLRQSITFDNGTEFSRHQCIASQIGTQTYFRDPRAPWQKGGVENAIGRLRRALPRKADLAALPQARLNAIIANYNNTPRKCLGFLTPAEIFNPLHFKCESTRG